MTRVRIIGFGLVVVTILTVLMFAPVGSNSTSGSFVAIQDACAQTGTCKVSAGDICFVNGEQFDDRRWIGGVVVVGGGH